MGRAPWVFCAFAIACSDESSVLDGGASDAGPSLMDAGSDVDAGPGGECVDGPPPPIEHVAVTDQGFVLGHERDGVSEFLGIPYVAAPVGELRLADPEPYGCFDGLFEASDFGPKCPQLDQGVFVGEEDCLQLNVWTPAVDSDERPILFFIHGGGNAQGSTRQEAAGQVIYRGSVLAAKTNTVVVTANYRVGQLGWLTHPSLDDASGHSGNYGLHDLVAALEWVKRNVAAFGGDPDRVMIFGESAGAVNTCMLLVSPLTKGLFSSALMESGGCPGYTRAQVEAESQRALDASGCAGEPDPVACLRGLDAEAIVRANPADIQVAGRSSLYQPHVDGYVLPESPVVAIGAGRHNEVPFVIGSNSDETSRSIGMIQTETDYEAAVRALFGPAIGAMVLEQYPAADYPTPRAALVRLTTDAKFACPARTVARAGVTGQDQPVYRYVFTHALEMGNLGIFGAWHGLELSFVFGLLEIGNYVPSANEVALSASIQSYWSSFAASGVPTDDAAIWEPYRPADDNFMRFEGGAIGMGSGFRTANCDFWDMLSAQLGG